MVAVGLALGAGSLVGQSQGGAVVSSEGSLPPRARASGCSARNPSGNGTPWISWRSTHTLATDRAAAVSSRRSARARAAGDSVGLPGELAEDVEVAGGLDADVASPRRHGQACSDLRLALGGPADAQAVGLALEVGAAGQVGGERRGRLLAVRPAEPAQCLALGHDPVDLADELLGQPAPAR